MRRTFACSLLMLGLAAGAARAQQAPQVDAHFVSASVRPGDAAQLEVITMIGADAPDDAMVTADPLSIGRSTFVLKISKTSYLFSGACPANRQCFEADIKTEARLTPGARQVPVTVTDSKGRTSKATASVQIADTPRDTDHDGLPDVWEQEYGLRFYSSEGVDGASGDPDGDGVSNLDEFRANTNPVERHVRLFAEGSAGEAQPIQSCVTILPMDPDQPIPLSQVHVVFVGDNGRVAYESFSPSRTPRTSCPLGLDVADRVVEIRVESEVPLAVERDTSSGPSPANARYPQVTNSSLGVQEPSRTWIFADGHTGDGIDMFLLLYNPSTAPATATLTYVRAPSTVVAQASRVLPPGIRTTIWVNQDQPEALGSDVSVTITADAGILAERAFRYHAPGRTVPHDSVSRGAWTTATHWYFPDVDSRGPFASSIVLMNPTTQPTKVTLTSQFPDRDPARLDIALAGGERRELTLRDLPVPSGTTFGVIVDASDGVGIVAERTSSGATSSGGWRRSALGAMQPGTSWILPTTGSLSLDTTDLVVLNVSDTPARVRIRMRYYGFECCETSEATVEVPARGSLHVPLGTNDPARTIPTVSNASLIVDSLPNASGATASIVVERTNYWDIDGVTRSRTNSIIGNQVH